MFIKEFFLLASDLLYGGWNAFFKRWHRLRRTETVVHTAATSAAKLLRSKRMEQDDRWQRFTSLGLIAMTACWLCFLLWTSKLLFSPILPPPPPPKSKVVTETTLFESSRLPLPPKPAPGNWNWNAGPETFLLD
ncbi:MAG: hypothetical protein AAFR61_10235 [Bacteroidota bacterium]